MTALRTSSLSASGRAVELLLGHSKLESTVRYLGIEVDDALENLRTDRDLSDRRISPLSTVSGRLMSTGGSVTPVRSAGPGQKATLSMSPESRRSSHLDRRACGPPHAAAASSIDT